MNLWIFGGGIGSPPEWLGQTLSYQSNIAYKQLNLEITEIEWGTPWGTVRGDVLYNTDKKEIEAHLSALRLRNSSVVLLGEDDEGNAEVVTNDLDDSGGGGPVQMLSMAYQALLRVYESGTQGQIKLAINSIDVGDKLVSNVDVDVNIKDSAIVLNAAEARLPGGTKVFIIWSFRSR